MKMKRAKSLIRRFWAVLLAAALTAVQPVYTMASDGSAEQDPYRAPVLEAEAILEEDGWIEGEADQSPTFRSSENALMDGSFYSRLNTRQKACYRALESISIDKILASPDRRVLMEIEGITGTRIKGQASNGAFKPAGDSDTQKQYKSMDNDMLAGLVALRYDRPDLLWLEGGVGPSYTFTTTKGSAYGTVSRAGFRFSLPYSGGEKVMRAQMMEAAQNLAAQAGRERDTYSRLLAAHNLIAAQARYNYTPDTEMERKLTHSAYSALIAGDRYEPVCDGYSKAFKLVCDMLRIPCILVSSKDHMWNNVKMDDGRWYNVDLTWDDGRGTGDTTYFLVGSQSVVGGSAFQNQPSHRELDPFTDSKVTVSGQKYPNKCPNAYVYLGQDYEPLRYPDVGRDDWFFDSVNRVSELGYFGGDASGRFNPNKNITRAEFARVMANVLGVDLRQYQGGDSFPDVPASAWYAPVAVWAKESKVMEGSGGKFRPNEKITRQEMCRVLVNALGLDEAQEVPSFADSASIADWARPQVYACYEAGLVKGDPNGRFNPRNFAKRSEAATMLQRYADSLEPES